MAAGRIVLSQYSPARDRSARLVSGALLYVYTNGTTTKASIYSDEALTTPLANPVAANSSGQFPAIWASDAITYTLSITAADGTSIGNPSVFDDYSVSVDAQTEAVALAEAAAASAAADLADMLAVVATGDDAAAIAARAAKSANGSDFADKEGVTQNLLFLQSGTGAASESLRAAIRRVGVYPEQYGAAADGATNDATALQAAMTAAAAADVPLILQPGKDYRTTTGLTVPAGLEIVGYGATISTAAAGIKLLTLAGSNTTIQGVKLSGPNSGYNVLSYGFFATGTVNGAAVAPSYLSNIALIDCEATGFGRTGIELDYVDGAKIVRPRLTNLGYSGVETLGSKNVSVVEPYIDTLTGETGSGELNAYGVTFSRNTGSSDTVRYPDSQDCSVVGGIVKNIPTWHGLDTHGGKRITFRGVLIRECRRAVVLTNATHTVPTDCLVEGNRAFNTAAVDATNSNASEKRAEAFWDVGLSDATPSLRNRFTNNYAFGYGPVTSNTGAYYFLHASGGEYLNNTDENSYIVGVRIDDTVTDFRLRGHVSRNCRAPATGGFNTSPVGYLVAGTSNSAADQSGIVENCRSVRDDTTVDTHVLSLGFRVATGTGRAIKLRNNDFEAATPGVSLETDDAGITGDLTRDHTLTVAGFDTTPTSVTVTATRNGPNVTLTFPLITGTSNSTGFTLSGLPAEIRPSANRHFCVKIMDSGTVAFGLMIPASDGTFTIAKGPDESASWTASGTKRLYPIAITYSISLPE